MPAFTLVDAPRNRRTRENLAAETWSLRLFFLVFGRGFVFRTLVRMNFALVRIGCILHAADRLGFKRLAFLDQLFDAFGIRFFVSGQSLKIARLPGRLVAQAPL